MSAHQCADRLILETILQDYFVFQGDAAVTTATDDWMDERVISVFRSVFIRNKRADKTSNK